MWLLQVRREADLTGIVPTITRPVPAGITSKASPMGFMGYMESACSPVHGQAGGLGSAGLHGSLATASTTEGNVSAANLY